MGNLGETTTSEPDIRSDLNISLANLSVEAEEWMESRDVIKDFFSSSLHGVMYAISKVQVRGDSMLTGIRKQRNILSGLNDEIEQGIKRLKDISIKMKNSEKVRDECNELIENYQIEMPRVQKLQSTLHKSVVKLEKDKFNTTKVLLSLREKVNDHQKELNESRPALARMSLEFDPDFVDTKVQLLESDISRLENSFVVTSGRVLDIDSKIAYKESYLSLLQDRIASLTQMESKVRTEMAGEQKTQNYDVSSLIGDGSSEDVVSSSPLVSAMMVSIVLNLVNFSILYYQRRNFASERIDEGHDSNFDLDSFFGDIIDSFSSPLYPTDTETYSEAITMLPL